MLKTSSIVFLVGWSFLAAFEMTAYGQAPATTSSRQEGPLYIDSIPPPPTLEELWNMADAVVRATVRSTSAAEMDPRDAGKRHPRASHMQTLSVVECFKNDTEHPIGREIRVRQYGGTIIVRGQEMSTSYPSPLFSMGDELILFLERNRGEEAYSVFGPWGAFRIDAATQLAAVPDEIQFFMSEFRGQKSVPVDTITSRLRTLKTKRQ